MDKFYIKRTGICKIAAIAIGASAILDGLVMVLSLGFLATNLRTFVQLKVLRRHIKRHGAPQ